MGGGWATEAVRRLGIELPIVAAPMGGGPSTPALVAAVSEAGGLGSLAGGYLSPDRLRKDIAAVREATSKPFAVNLFAPTPVDPGTEDVERALAALEAYRLELELPARPTAGGPWAEDFDAQRGVFKAPNVIGSLDTGDWVKYDNVNFGSGVTHVEMRLALPSRAAGKKIEIRVGGTSGSLLGTLTTTGTGDWDVYKSQSKAIKKLAGVQDLYLVFRGGGGVAVIDSLKFT